MVMWTELGYLALGNVAGAGIMFSICQGRFSRKLEQVDLLFEKETDVLHMKLRSANAQRDEAVQKLRSWRPDAKSLDEAWAEAERMANHRKMLQAGRSSVPRSDAGPPAKLYRANLRGGPRKPLNGI